MKKTLKTLKWLWHLFSQFKLLLLLTIGLSALLSLSNVYKAILGKHLIDNASIGNFQKTIIFLSILGSILILEIILSSFNSYISTYCSTELTNKMQKGLFEHIIHSDWLESSNYHSGYFLTKLTDDVNIVTNLLVGTIPSIISLVVLLLTSFIALLFYAPLIAFFCLILAPLIVIISKLFAKKIRKLHIEMQETESNYRSFMQESLLNNLIIKTFCLEENSVNNLTKIQKHKLKITLSRSLIGITSNAALFVGSLTNYFLVFLWGAYNLSKGTGAFGTLTALLQLSGNIQGPMSKLASSFPQIISAFASIERLMEIEKMTLEPHFNSLDSDIEPSYIEFKNIDFSYNQDKPVLRNISFTINPGDTIGLVGPSGEGKTTLIRLILSLINEDKGSKCLINNRITKISPETRKLISYVPQGNTLFSGTIEENLRFGHLNASVLELEAALKASCAWDFVNSLENKLNTKIGEKGAGLSEGQAQRLAIARAFLRKKPILILDEATSSLDSETEVKILKAISNLEHKPTCIIITHRLSALSICNRIFRLENTHLYETDNSSKVESAVAIQ